VEGARKPVILLDTHIVVWLYQKSLNLISPKALQLLENEELSLSPVSTLEIEYLFEIKKIKIDARTMLGYLENKIGLTVDSVEATSLVEIALSEKWTRDPFDRMIVAHAKLRNTALVTRDKTILKHYHRAIS
jgi:PIN domain nuclease of toxin-antitoxin system